ncbi:zinc-ribbon domain-containing protein [Candidatus Pelagibacter sp.]|nr:zinc-ribbon domain-containing protein [Candidatus Pelagibacter sp.]
MIITCPSCEKKFEVDENLIPDNGRLLKCGSCDQTWFFNKNPLNNNKKNDIVSQKIVKNENKDKERLKKNDKIVNEKVSDLPDNKGSELIQYKPKSTLSFVKLLSFMLVSVISFIALIIVLDTFKNPLSIFFPNLELILYNLFETVKDLILFVKDLK